MYSLCIYTTYVYGIKYTIQQFSNWHQSVEKKKEKKTSVAISLSETLATFLFSSPLHSSQFIYHVWNRDSKNCGEYF
jgi:hypothetical protein